MFDGWLPLVERKMIADDTMAFWFSTEGTNFEFIAGQSIDLFLDDLPEPDPEGTKRSFSIASAPSEAGRILIATRLRPTPFKNALRTLPIGTPVHIVAAFGSLVLHEKVSRPAVFLAGGIGITPFRSMIVQALAQSQSPVVTLLYSNRTASSAAFIDELRALQAKHAQRFTLIATVTDEPATSEFRAGRIDDALLNEATEKLTEPVYYVTGPPAFVEAMVQLLKARRVSTDDIRTEPFTGYATARGSERG